jgi:hypothetical protein
MAQVNPSKHWRKILSTPNRSDNVMDIHEAHYQSSITNAGGVEILNQASQACVAFLRTAANDLQTDCFNTQSNEGFHTKPAAAAGARFEENCI